MIGLVCDAFACLPSQAQRELEQGDPDLVFTILEMRAYVQGYQVIRHAKQQGDIDLSQPAVRRAWEIEALALMGRT